MDSDCKTVLWGEFTTPHAKAGGNGNQLCQNNYASGLAAKKTGVCNKLFELNEQTFEREYNLKEAQDKNIMDSVKLLENYFSSNLATVSEPAFVIANFSSGSLNEQKISSQQSGKPNILNNPQDAKELLTKSVATLMMHKEILNCKSSVLVSLVAVAEMFLQKLGVQLALATEGMEKMHLEDLEIVLKNCGICGVEEVLQYYQDSVLHHKVFLEASVTRGVIQPREESEEPQ